MSSIVQRFMMVKETLGLTKAKFCKDIEVSVATFDNYFNGKGIPKAIFLANICEKFRVDGTWLLTGKGEMFIKEDTVMGNELTKMTKELLVVERSMGKAARIAAEAMKAVIEGEIEAENMRPIEGDDRAANG